MMRNADKQLCGSSLGVWVQLCIAIQGHTRQYVGGQHCLS